MDHYFGDSCGNPRERQSHEVFPRAEGSTMKWNLRNDPEKVLYL
jgi:hypothetical protein